MNQEKLNLPDYDHEHVDVHMHGALGVITLNRPEALNALSLEMIRSITAILELWREDPEVKAVLFTGAGEKAFCAGGDIKACYKVGMDYRRGETSLKVAALFFAEEYAFNKLIYNYPKPTISFMNGIVMGGGFGIAGHCRYRIVTDKTLFSMPEVRIGFFPDVASLYYLSQFKNNTGRYLALTGSRIKAEDAYYVGVGSFFINYDQKHTLIDSLSMCVAIQDVLDGLSHAPDCSEPMGGYIDNIDTVFAHDTVADILQALKDDDSTWASDIFDLMTGKASPASICVTAEYFRQTKDKNVEEILDMDFSLAQNFLERSDLYEGIRAAVIDRQHKPVWEFRNIDDVTQADVNEYFRDGAYDLKDMSDF